MFSLYISGVIFQNLYCASDKLSKPIHTFANDQEN